MPPPSQKQLELRLVVSADTMQGNLALQQLAAQATRVEQAAGKAGHAIGVANKGGAGGMGAGAAGGGGPGIGGAAMGMIGAAGGWIAAGAAVAATLSNMTTAVQGLNNPMLTAREQALGFAKALPLVGGALASLIDNAMDAIDRISDPETSARVDRARIEDPILMAQEQARFGARQRGHALYAEVRGAENRLGGIRGTPTIDYTLRDNLNSSAGFGKAGALFSYASRQNMDPRLSASEDAIQAAKRGVDIASRNAASSESDVLHARRASGVAGAAWRAARERSEAEDREAKEGTGRREKAFDRTYENARRAGGLFDTAVGRNFFAAGSWLAPSTVDGPGGVVGSKFSREDAIQKETKATQVAQNALLDLENKITANKEKQLNLLQKQADLARAETGWMKTKLGLLDEELAKVRGGTTAFVAMDKVSQGALLEAAQRFDKGGRENVTGEEFSMLQGNPLTNELVQKRLKKDAIDNGGAADLLKITGQRDEETIGREREKLKLDIDMKVQVDEEQFAKVMTEKLKQFNLKELLGEIVKGQLAINLRKPQLDSDRGRLEAGN